MTKESNRVASQPEVLHACSVSKSFIVSGQTNRILAGIDLAIPFGSVVAIVGPTGCGKSTLLEIICGLQQPDRGSHVLLGDVDITGKRGFFGYMPQRDALLPWKSALNNAMIGLTARGVSASEARERARELFVTFRLDKYERYYPGELSGGMRQRVALLRTFLFPSLYVLLDEPFTALDAITRANVHMWLLDVLAELPRTVLLVTHDVDEAIFLADRIIVLGTRPGHVALDIPVRIPRPRSLGVEALEAFQSVRADVMHTLGQFVPGLLRSSGDSTPDATTPPMAISRTEEW